MAAALWNKSLWLRPRFCGASSGTGEKLVRAGSDGAGCLVAARLPPALGDSDVGVGFPVFQRGTLRASVKRCRMMAAGLVVERWVELCFFLSVRRRRAQIHGQKSTGCVPGRWSSIASFLCGSIKSLRAMVFLLAWASSLSSPFPDGGAAVDEGGRVRRLKTADGRCTKDPWTLIVIFFLGRIFSANWPAQPSLLY